MPIDLGDYPANWKEISLTLRAAANWHCQNCNRPCRQPRESLDRFCDRINKTYPKAVAEEINKLVKVHRTYFTLTVAHLDQDPANNDASNLRCLCAVCHLNFDRKFINHNRLKKRERRGQLNLFDLTDKGISS